MDIVYSSTQLLNIKPLTTVNGNACYEIETKDKECSFKHKYICVPQSTKFIALKHAGSIHIFNLVQDGAFPDEFKTYIDEINEKLMKYFNERSTGQVLSQISDEINRDANPHNFVIVRPTSPPCEQFLNLDDAKHVIQSLNDELQKTCRGFHLHIDYITSFPSGSTVSMYSDVRLNTYIKPPLLLCLMHGKDCVSSITLKVSKSQLNIDSRTNALYEGRKFNTLLRAVAIIISKSLNQSAEHLTSNAANIISAILMIKRFNACTPGGDISKIAIRPDKLDKIINDYFSHNDGMETMVELNEENIANARSVFHETVARMNCGPLAGGRKKRSKRKSNGKTLKRGKSKDRCKSRRKKHTGLH
jgi:hypothetical protein